MKNGPLSQNKECLMKAINDWVWWMNWTLKCGL